MYGSVHRKLGTPIKTLSTVGHVSEDILEEYAFLRLSNAETAIVEEHLLICPRCCQTLQKIDEFVLAVKQCPELAANSVAGGSIPRRFFGYGAALFAAVLGLTIATVIPRTHRMPDAKAVQLVAFRGGETGAMISAQAGAVLNLVVDLADLTPSGLYRLQIVNTNGIEVWTDEARANAGTLSMRMSPGLERGVYWIRLYSGGNLLREFGLRAH